MSSILRGEPQVGAESEASKPPAVPPIPPAAVVPTGSGALGRNGTLTVIAGVGVLLLAMGVGVLIGRSGQAKPAATPPQVITVAGPASPGSSSSPAAEATFTSSWPSGTNGYTVQLQTLASGTTVSAVQAAKSAASAKGAKAVGALASEEFTSLTAGSYVIYSGVYNTQAEAQKALAGVKQSFPSAKVIKVANGGSGSAGSGSASPSSPGGASSESHPAPSTVLKSLKGAKGKSYEEKSKSLPDVVETG